MRSAVALAVAALLAGGCTAAGAPGGSVASRALTATPRSAPSSTSSATPNSTGAAGGSPSPTPGAASATVTCTATPAGPMALVGRAIYDVTDPLRPRLLCRIAGTVAHLFTTDTFEYIRPSGDQGTELVLHSIGSGNESVAARWPLQLTDLPMGGYGSWTLDGDSAATFASGTDASGSATIQVWLFAQAKKRELYDFPQPLTDCICRFGLPPPVLSFSPDGRYLVSGWPIGKGAQPLRVYRVADASLVVTLNVEDTLAIWSPTGDRLYASGSSGSVATWAPDDRLVYLADTPVWPYMAGMSPDGKKVVYTDYADQGGTANLRVYLFDIATQSTRMLVDQPRSEVTFVKDGWVWYLEEAPCADCPGQSGPTDTVFAMNLSTGGEQKVTFSAHESPADLQTGWGPAEFYPNS